MTRKALSKIQKELFLERCVDSVKRNQGRMTLSRQTLFETLATADEPLGAYEVLERARKHAKHLDVTTVYRNLEFLAAEGLIHEFGHEGWVACSHLGSSCGSLHILLRCQSCDYREESCLSNTEGFLKSLHLAPSQRKLKPTASVIVGICERCSEGEQTGAKKI